jgi:hypothetical protein
LKDDVIINTECGLRINKSRGYSLVPSSFCSHQALFEVTAGICAAFLRDEHCTTVSSSTKPHSNLLIVHIGCTLPRLRFQPWWFPKVRATKAQLNLLSFGCHSCTLKRDTSWSEEAFRQIGHRQISGRVDSEGVYESHGCRGKDEVLGYTRFTFRPTYEQPLRTRSEPRTSKHFHRV